MKQTKNIKSFKSPKIDKTTLPRLFRYVFKYYPFKLILVLLCIIASSLSSVVSSYFIGNILVTNFITPALNKANELHLDNAYPLLFGPEKMITWNNISFTTTFLKLDCPDIIVEITSNV